MSRGKAFLLIAIVLAFQSCHCLPFLKYSNTGRADNFPKFREKHQYRGSAQPLRTAYDVTCYNWSIEVQPRRKRLEGTMRMHFRRRFRD